MYFMRIISFIIIPFCNMLGNIVPNCLLESGQIGMELGRQTFESVKS